MQVQNKSNMTSFPPGWGQWKQKVIPNISKDMEQPKLFYIASSSSIISTTVFGIIYLCQAYLHISTCVCTKIQICIHWKIYSNIFIAALFVIVKNLYTAQTLINHTTDNQLWSINKMEYYTATRTGNYNDTHHGWMPRNKKWKKSDTKENTLCYLYYTKLRSRQNICDSSSWNSCYPWKDG